jgi:hypothetical protein
MMVLAAYFSSRLHCSVITVDCTLMQEADCLLAPAYLMPDPFPLFSPSLLTPITDLQSTFRYGDL